MKAPQVRIRIGSLLFRGILALFPAAMPAYVWAQEAESIVIILPNDLHPDWAPAYRTHLTQQGLTNVRIKGNKYNGMRSRLYCRRYDEAACRRVAEALSAQTGGAVEPRPLPEEWEGDVAVGLGDDLSAFLTKELAKAIPESPTPAPGPESSKADENKEAPKPIPARSRVRSFDDRIAFTVSAGAGHVNPVFGGAFELEVRPMTFFFGIGKWVSPTLPEGSLVPQPVLRGYGSSAGAGFYYGPIRFLQFYLFGLYGTARKLAFPQVTKSYSEPSALVGVRLWPLDFPLFFRFGAGVQHLPSEVYDASFGIALDFAIGLSTSHR